MRIWSIHPRYLDSKGLVALWRESLLAKSVLLGKTKGYINHPQLNRFRGYSDPILAINTYLYYVYLESLERGYSFDKTKIGYIDVDLRITVNSGQVEYEWEHLLKKLEKRDRKRFNVVKFESFIQTNSLFEMVSGPIEQWERV
jgi:hypothetical protein